MEYYTAGSNEWKEAQNWPIPDTDKVEIYLSSDGKANTSSGDGKLIFEKSEKKGLDGYKYDPKNPSTYIIDVSENEIGVPELIQRKRKSDILCYTTETLEEDFTITGDIEAEFYISSSAVDTDFVIRILDVNENGKSIKLADGVISAKYRDGF